MREMNLNHSQLAELCHCSPRKINEIVNGKSGISPHFAIELEKAIVGFSTLVPDREEVRAVYVSGRAIKKESEKLY